MNRSIRQFSDRKGGSSRSASAFTLVELLSSLAIISILITMSAHTFRRVNESNVLAQAQNAVVAFAKLARSYAVAHHVETMMVVNPYNGRFELWHLNPPRHGGAWDPLSETLSDGYVFAPIFDASAKLPLDGDGLPAAVVNPIDYDDAIYRPIAADAEERNLDNLTWAAFCFDEEGQLVIRTRRIATRSYTRRDGSTRPVADRNRLIDETPDLALLLTGPLVAGGAAGDTAITSTRGFVISEATRMRSELGKYATQPSSLVNNWLLLTRNGGPFSSFAASVVLNRYSSQELTGAL
jgi:prepilin-type N-terminal cleavage/methylation domain-containing protein